MADIYRKSSLEKLSNPEQLDRMIKISSPLSWLALVAVAFIIATTVVWSIIGKLPTTQTVNGVIVDSENVGAIYSDYTGTIEQYYVKVGDKINSGDKIAKIKQEDGTVKNVCSDQNGVLSAQSLIPDSQVFSGTEVARITPNNVGEDVVVCYVPIAYAQMYEKGMKVLVYPSYIDSQKYGHMEAEIVSVEKYATNVNSLVYVLGNGNMVSDMFVSNGPVAAVVCKIKTDKSTASGYYWSSEKGEDFTITSGTIVTAKIVVEECAPISKLISIFKKSMGD